LAEGDSYAAAPAVGAKTRSGKPQRKGALPHDFVPSCIDLSMNSMPILSGYLRRDLLDKPNDTAT
jgi:hypothetical protein